MREYCVLKHRRHWWGKPTDIATIILGDSGVQVAPGSQIEILPGRESADIKSHLIDGICEDFKTSRPVKRGRLFLMHHRVPEAGEVRVDPLWAEVNPFLFADPKGLKYVCPARKRINVLRPPLSLTA